MSNPVDSEQQAMSNLTDINQASELLRELKSILAAHEALMLAINGRPDCKNCALAETIQELIDKEQTNDKDS